MAEEDKVINIEGDLGPGKKIVVGEGNIINGEPQSNPTLPSEAKIVETPTHPTEPLSEADRMLAEIYAKLENIGTTPRSDTPSEKAASIGGETSNSVIIQGNDRKVDTQTSEEGQDRKDRKEPETRTLPFRAGGKITNSNISGQDFQGTWVLKSSDGGNYVYQKEE